MAAQADLVSTIGRFTPRIVRMADEEGHKGRKARPVDPADGE